MAGDTDRGGEGGEVRRPCVVVLRAGPYVACAQVISSHSVFMRFVIGNCVCWSAGESSSSEGEGGSMDSEASGVRLRFVSGAGRPGAPAAIAADMSEASYAFNTGPK